MSNKINLDKYYTPIYLANYCIDKLLENIDLEEISEVIEPSFGCGNFLHHDKLFVHFAYDIEPEFYGDTCYTQLIKGDFLKQNIVYLPGRLIIGNPPYGERMNLVRKFYKKSIEIADYIAFILPISQLNNINSLYEFDLIYSEDLGVQEYSDRKLHCCFNIYKRPENGELNKKPNNKLNQIKIYRQDKKDYNCLPYDVRMCYWGDGTAGKILKENEHYSAEYKIIVNIEEPKKQEIVNFIKNFDWWGYVNCIAAKKIQQFHIYDVLKENFDYLK